MMSSLLRIFFIGMLVSFLGSLPLGTLNIAAMQISIAEGAAVAMLFSLGSLLAEMIYVRLSLVAMDWVRKQEKLLRALDWATVVIVGLLAASSFYAAMQPSAEKNIILGSSLPKILLGFLMSAVNPVQIPFWFGWSTVLFAKGILKPVTSQYNSYIVGIGLGTFIGNCVFIFGGQWVASSINHNQSLLNWVIGGIFTLTAVWQLIKIIRHKDTAHRLEHPAEDAHKREEQLHLLKMDKTQKN
jgi:threonine/homoserine/homoserine lactone efflux protein